MPQFPTSQDRAMVRASVFKSEDEGFEPRLRRGNSFKKTKIYFFIEKGKCLNHVWGSFTGERNILCGCGIFRAGAEYSVRVRDIPCGCRIFRAGAKYSVQPLAYSVLPLAVSIRLSKWPLADSKPVGEREPTRIIVPITWKNWCQG